MPTAATSPAPVVTAARPSAPALLFRLAQVVVHGLLIGVPALPSAAARAAVHGRAAGTRHLYHRFTVLLIRLGPAFVKIGQVLGTRRDVLPPALCDELALLQDSVPPMGVGETRKTLERLYRGEFASVFTDFEYRPVASGSVASVFRARLGSGPEVAVKLRRPGIDVVMRRDLTLIRRGAEVAARLPLFRGMPVREVVAHLTGAILGQLDFAREAQSLIRLRANLAAVPRVWVPKVYPEQSRPECIVMEFIPGLDSATAAGCSPATRRRFAASGITAMYQMLFVDGFVHCDLHPGNLYFTLGAQVVVLDAGFSVQLSDELRRLFAEFFMNMSIGRGRHAAEIVVRSAEGVRDDADLEGFLVRMADLVERCHGQPARDFSLIAFATEMFDLQRRFGIHAAPELVFPLLSLLVIEGTIRELDPELDFQKTARSPLMRGLFGAR